MRRFTRFSKRSLPLRGKKSKYRGINWTLDRKVKKRIANLIMVLNLDWLQKSRIFCFRSENANTRAIARIWGFSHIWQKALREPPAYIIEVISERFDQLDDKEKDKVLLHEITHIPKNFSGSLMPHIRRGKRNFHNKVNELIIQYERLNQK